MSSYIAFPKTPREFYIALYVNKIYPDWYPGKYAQNDIDKVPGVIFRQADYSWKTMSKDKKEIIKEKYMESALMQKKKFAIGLKTINKSKREVSLHVPAVDTTLRNSEDDKSSSNVNGNSDVTDYSAVSDTEPATRRSSVHDEDSEPATRRSSVHDEDSEPATRRSSVHDEDSKPATRRSSVHDEDSKPATRRSSVHDEDSKPATRRSSVHDEDSKPATRRSSVHDEDDVLMQYSGYLDNSTSAVKLTAVNTTTEELNISGTHEHTAHDACPRTSAQHSFTDQHHYDATHFEEYRPLYYNKIPAPFTLRKVEELYLVVNAEQPELPAWKDLTEPEKRPYYAAFRKLKHQYIKAYENYLLCLSPRSLYEHMNEVFVK